MISLRLVMDGTGVFPELEGKSIVEPLDLTIAGLPRGMTSGAPSVAMIGELPDGRFLFAQTSLRVFIAAARALEIKYEKELEES